MSVLETTEPLSDGIFFRYSNRIFLLFVLYALELLIFLKFGRSLPEEGWYFNAPWLPVALFLIRTFSRPDYSQNHDASSKGNLETFKCALSSC